jgi:hypothetical protein
MGARPRKPTYSGARTSETSDPTTLMKNSTPMPRYWPAMTCFVPNSGLAKKARRMKMSSILVAAKTAMARPTRGKIP